MLLLESLVAFLVFARPSFVRRETRRLLGGGDGKLAVDVEGEWRLCLLALRALIVLFLSVCPRALHVDGGKLSLSLVFAACASLTVFLSIVFAAYCILGGL